MENLKLKDQVLYFDGFTQLELTTVISDFEDGTVKLAGLRNMILIQKIYIRLTYLRELSIVN